MSGVEWSGVTIGQQPGLVSTLPPCCFVSIFISRYTTLLLEVVVLPVQLPGTRSPPISVPSVLVSSLPEQ